MNKPLVKNASDESQVRNAEIKKKLIDDQEKNDLRFILSTDQGRRFIWKQLQLCGVFKSSFTGSSETYFLEGQRNIGLKLLADVMDADPESYLKMFKKQKETN
jgi:hypothetical protein